MRVIFVRCMFRVLKVITVLALVAVLGGAFLYWRITMMPSQAEMFRLVVQEATVLKETVPDSPVAVEGYTDNEPIKYSGWKSNWELSSARALAVVHYFIDRQGLDPVRLRAVGFGEHHPVASNDAPEGRRQNRRVEVVILPKDLKKSKTQDDVLH